MSGSSLPTESTALLGNAHNFSNHVPSLPPIYPLGIHAISHPNEAAISNTSSSTPHVFPTTTAKAAFDLIILLQSFANEKARESANSSHSQQRGSDVWDRWSKEIDVSCRLRELERRARDIWSEYLHDYRSTQEIEELLWLEFPIEDGSLKCLRVVDCIQRVDGPDDLLCHPIVYMSLLRTWKHGRLPERSGDPSNAGWLRRVDSHCTPRVLQCMDLLYRLSFVATLVHFLLYPSAWNAVNRISLYPGLRETILIIYPLAVCASPWSMHSLSSILVLATFLFNWNDAPRPGDVSFTVLHLALALHILQLHAPYPPSPVFLFAVHGTLPLSAALSYGAKRIILPALLYFLPALLWTAFVLSLSLTDTLFLPNSIPQASPPVETRSAFLALFVIVVAILLSSPLVLLIGFPPSSSTPISWDRYSKPIGLDARRAFVRAIVRYGTPYMFPPPFNVIQLVFARFPLAVLRRIGNRGLAIHFLRAEMILWRIVVVPIAILVSGVWGSGWRA